MTQQFSRRDFLKLAGLGAATTVLTGCIAQTEVRREPYQQMPEYTYNGQSTYYATTCRECAAGCGLIVRTMNGRAIKVEGNANNPLNMGKTCARGQATLHGLYNPNRIRGPIQHKRGDRLYASGSEPFTDGGFEDESANMNWDEAAQVLADAFTKYQPDEIAFLFGMAPDHLFDLASDLASKTGANAPTRFSVMNLFDSRATLVKAAEEMLGTAALPFFDIGNSDFVLSVGANFLETWLSPVSYTRGFAGLRRGSAVKRGYFVQIEPRMSQTASKADIWIPAKPGTEGLVAAAIGKLVSELGGKLAPKMFEELDPAQVAKEAGVSIHLLEETASKLIQYSNPIVVPGGSALGLSNGLAVAEAALAFNAMLGNLGQPGGVYVSTAAPAESAISQPANAKEITDFVAMLNSGKIKALFIHGVNPVFELPASLGFAEALANVAQVISFATFPDETATASDYVFPDHHGLESWGYQRAATGSELPLISGSQPVVTPYYDTRATVDVLLAAAQKAGGKFAEALPYADEVEFLRAKLSFLVGAPGFFTSSNVNEFMAYFQQNGGYWKTANELIVPTASNKNVELKAAEFEGEGEFFLVPFVSPTLGEAGANKPWLQELPDSTTTVMWNSFVAINPETAHELHIEDDDIVRIVSEAGEIEVSVYRYPAIRPDTIAIMFGQGHTAYGRYAEGRGINPVDLLGAHFNEAGDLTFAGMKVKVEKTGTKKPLSRLESIMGVYGVGMGEEH